MKKQRKPPVEKGEIISRGIVGLGDKGNPFVKVDGFIIYINDWKDKKVKIGEMLKLKITKVFKTFGFCEIVE